MRSGARMTHYYDHDTRTEVTVDGDGIWVTLRSYVCFTPDGAFKLGQALIAAAYHFRKQKEADPREDRMRQAIKGLLKIADSDVVKIHMWFDFESGNSASVTTSPSELRALLQDLETEGN